MEGKRALWFVYKNNDVYNNLALEKYNHCRDVIMSVTAPQITGVSIVYTQPFVQA